MFNHKTPYEKLNIMLSKQCLQLPRRAINQSGMIQTERTYKQTYSIDEIQTWSTKWLLKFHPDKCKTMTVTRKRQPEARPYPMKKKVDGVEVDHVLSKVDSEKDLGIKVDAKLSFEQHINDKVNKANQMMGLVRRSFIYLDKENFRWLYKAIVRPHVEYINTV